MTINQIKNVVLSTQVNDFGLYSSNRNHVRNPEEMFELNEREEYETSTDDSEKVVWMS